MILKELNSTMPKVVDQCILVEELMRANNDNEALRLAYYTLCNLTSNLGVGGHLAPFIQDMLAGLREEMEAVKSVWFYFLFLLFTTLS